MDKDKNKSVFEILFYTWNLDNFMLFRNNETGAHALLYMQIYSVERGLLYII